MGASYQRGLQCACIAICLSPVQHIDSRSYAFDTDECHFQTEYDVLTVRIGRTLKMSKCVYCIYLLWCMPLYTIVSWLCANFDKLYTKTAIGPISI